MVTFPKEGFIIIGILFIMYAGFELCTLVLGLPLVSAMLLKTEVAYIVAYYPAIYGLKVAASVYFGAYWIRKGIMEGV